MRILTPALALLVFLAACSPEQQAIEEPADTPATADAPAKMEQPTSQKNTQRKNSGMGRAPELEWQEPKSELPLPELERAQPFDFIQIQSRYEQQFDKNDALDLVLINRAQHTAYRNLRVGLIYIGESGNILRRDTVRIKGDLLVERALKANVPITNPPAEWIPFAHEYRTEVVTASPVK